MKAFSLTVGKASTELTGEPGVSSLQFFHGRIAKGRIPFFLFSPVTIQELLTTIQWAGFPKALSQSLQPNGHMLLIRPPVLTAGQTRGLASGASAQRAQLQVWLSHPSSVTTAKEKL